LGTNSGESLIAAVAALETDESIGLEEKAA
jgi:hypothetical protein